MDNKIEFENHFAARVVEISFPEGYRIQSQEDLAKLKKEWTQNLKSWHSPYTCIFDLRDFKIAPEFFPQFEATIRFFKNFFMRKIIGYRNENSSEIAVGFDVVVGYETALKQTPLGNEKNPLKGKDDLRGRIQIDNDFNAHVMEVNFSGPTHFETVADIDILKSKLTNILMMWHSPYSVMFNCVNCTFSPEAKLAFVKVERFLKGFFCKSIIGYAPKAEKDSYPFQMYRARHQAAATLEHSGLDGGDVANCSTRKN